MAAVGGPVPPAVHEPAAAMRWLGKPGPAYPGFPAQGASAPTGGRASGSPPREGGLPGRGGYIGRNGAVNAPESADAHGSGSPGGDSPAGSSRGSRRLAPGLNGRVGGHQDQPRRPRPLWRRTRPTGPATVRPGLMGQPRRSPGHNWGTHGQLWVKGGKRIGKRIGWMRV
jgi:hypothetical protein